MPVSGTFIEKQKYIKIENIEFFVIFIGLIQMNTFSPNIF